MAATRTFEGVLVLNWKTKGTRVIKAKHKNKEYGPYEIPIRYKIEVVIPERTEQQIQGTIEIPKEKVAEITLKAISDNLEEQKNRRYR